MNNFKQKLINILKKEPDFVDIETQEINYNKVKDSADKIDEKLISLLIQDKGVKEKFFTKIKDVYVFNIKDFKFFLDENKIDNSYTQYENRIGLATNKGLLKDNSEVVLNWPYKDCILEGGQSTEEGMDSYFEYSEKKEEYEEKEAKRKEIFFNEILAQDEIDRLLDDKALINWKKYTKDGEQEVEEIKRDLNVTIKENLIIKGYNLLALHSLKKQFAGKIKLIYIDPPYNTAGNANTFTYNNTFNHSSWLSFLKNRLEVSRDFLKEDGIIAISIDDEELFYLGVLLDQIFGRKNKIGTVCVRHHPRGRTQSNFFSTVHEYTLFYAKNILQVKENFCFESNKEEETESFIRSREDATPETRPMLYYPIYYNPKTKEISLENKNKDFIKILPINKNGKRTWKLIKESFLEELKEGKIFIKKTRDEYSIYRKIIRSNANKAKTMWTDSKYDANHHGTELLKKIFDGKKLFTFPKSIYTILDIIKLTTKEKDIIMDFFGGSGTTAHAILKLNKENNENKKFILIEQLDKHVDVITERLKKIIKQESCNDNFIYCELAKWNEKAKEEIQNAKDLTTLIKLFDTLYEKYFLNYNVKIKEFKENIIEEEKFKELALEEQKKIFLTMLDLNQMYIQKSEMSDKKFGISEKDQKLTEEFYKNI